MKITPELTRIVGHLYGDGCLDKNGKMYYINKNDALISNFIKYVQNAFGKTIKFSIYVRPNGVKRVYIEKRVANLLREEFPELKNRLKVPLRIKNSTSLNKSSFLQAMFDDEGSIQWNKKTSSRSISIALKNRRVLQEIKEILLYTGIKSNKIRRAKSTYSGFMWKFIISSQTNLEDFTRKINFFHPKKRAKLLIMLKDFEQPHRKKSDTVDEILKTLHKTKLTIPEIQNLIKRSETQTRRIVEELNHSNLIMRSSRKIIYDSLGRKKQVNLWSTNNCELYKNEIV